MKVADTIENLSLIIFKQNLLGVKGLLISFTAAQF